MASFPDLRPGRRSARAENQAARRIKPSVLVAVSAALLLTAFLAVSELATLRGTKAHDASAFLTRGLGSPLRPDSLVRTPARNVEVAVQQHGYRVTHGKTSLLLRSPLAGGDWQSYQHGAQRPTSVGHETILIDEESAEEFLTVTRRQGPRTWRWRLDTKLEARLTSKGFVGFFDGRHLTPLGIEPVAILDAKGRDVTPAGLEWSVAKRGKHTWLELALDDRGLAVPYTIDPTINFRAAGSVAGSASGTTINVGIPAATRSQDLLLLHVAVRSTTIPSTPTGWTVVANTNTANNNISQVVFWKKAASGDAGGSVAVTIPNAAAVGVVDVYRGVNTLGSPIQQTTTSSTPNSRDVTCPTLVTNNANEMVLCAGSISTNGTWPASGGGYTRRATGAQGTSISLGWYDQFAATSGTSISATFTNVAGSPTRNIGNAFGLLVDTTNPTNGPITLTGVSPAGIAVLNGGTIYYRGSAAGQFQLRDAFTDVHSATESVNYPLVSSAGWTHANETVTTTPNFQSSNYSWSAGTTTPPTAAERTLTESDGAGNTNTQVVAIVNDTTAPASQTITLTGANAPYYSANSISFTLGDGSDGGSGLDTATRTVTREHATLSGDSCGTFTADAGTYTSPDTSVSSGNCYRYTFTINDRVGNTSTGVTATAKVDGGAPAHGTVTITGVSPAGIAYASGGTVYYRGSAAGQFQLRDPATDALTAVASVNYPLVSSAGWTHANETVTTGPNFQSSNYSWSAGTTTPPTAAERTLNAADRAGNTSTLAVPILNDTTAPASQTITLTGTDASPNYYKSNSVSFTLGDGSDSGSGLDTSTRTVTREHATLSGDTCGSFTADAGTYTSPDTSVSSGNCYRYSFTIKDNVGNTSTAVTTTAKVDGGAPSHGTIALTGVSPAGIAFLSGGGTVYYRGSAAGQFQLRDPATDSVTAAASVNYPLVSSAGWTHANETVTSSPNFQSSNYSWSAGTTTPPTAAERTLTAADLATNTATFAVPIVNDTTAPSVTAPTVSAGYYTSLSVGVTLNGGSDGGSGLAAGSSVVQRDEATLSGGSCGSFSGSWTNVTLSGGNDTTVQTGKCYHYREQLTDNVGNTGSSSASAIAKVDSGGPSNSLSLTAVSPAGSALKNGDTVYYRGAETGGGSFKLRNAVSDPASGPASSQTAALGGTTTGWTHTTSTVSTPAGGPYDSNDFTWAQGTTSAPTEVVTGRDAAGNATAAAALTFVNDGNAPTGGALTVNGTAATGGGTSSYDTDGSFTIGTRTDYSETQSGSESGLAASTLVRTSASYSSPDTCGSFGSPSTISGNPDQTGLSTGCYRYTLTGTDNVGNTVAISTVVKVDTSDPAAPTLTPSSATGGAYYPGTGTRVYFKPDAATGGFDLAASSSDSDTDIASYTFPAGSGLGTNWSGSGTGSSRTYSYTATATSNGLQNVSATNNAGRSATSTFDVTADSTAPSGGALTVNGSAAGAGGTTSYDTDGSFTIGTRTDYAETQSGSASGLASSTLVRTSASYSGTDTCGSFGSPSTITGNPDQNGLTTGCYRYTLTGTDNVGNAVSISTTVKVDTSAPSTPSLSLGSATGGVYYSGSGNRVFFRPDAATGGFDVTASATDADTGVASYAFPAGSALGTNWSGSGAGASRTYSYTATATTNGAQNVTATNNAGGTSGNGTFDVTADSTAPAGGALTVNGSAATGGTSSSYDTDGSFTIDSRTDYSEAASATASGLASSTLVRTTATFSSADTCGSFASPTTITGTPDQTGLPTGCYRYTLTGTDNVGNAVAVSTIVKVDTSAPSNPALTISGATGGAYYPGAGSQVFFRPAAANGGFDVAASSTDGDTGIAGYTFPTAASMGSNWAVSGSGASRTYSFTAVAGEPATKSVSASNNAGGSASSTFTATADSAAPTTAIQCNGAACLNGTYYTSSPVNVTLAGNDGTGSGVQKIRYTIDGTDPTPVNGSDYTGAISIVTTTTVKFRAYDNVGNEEPVGSQEILLDASPPTVSLTLSENPASGAQHVSGSTLFYRPGAAGGTFRVEADAQDAQTGVTSVDFPSVANVTGGGSQTSAPYREDYSWNAATTDATSHDVVATNGAGATSPEPFTLTQDSAAPSGQSITLMGATAPYYGTASVSFSLGDGNDGSGSGIDTSTRTVTRESAPLTGDNCGSFSVDAGTYSSPDTSVSGGNCYRYSFTVRDNVGNDSAAVTATAKVDTAAPVVTTDVPTELTGAGNQYYDAGSKTHYYRSGGSGSFRLNASANDTHTAVTGVGFPDVSGLTGWSGSTGGTDNASPYSSPADYTWSAGASDPGSRTITASDKASNSGNDTITITDDSAAPTGQAITLTGGSAPYFSSASVTFTLTDGTDAASGLDLSSRSVTRETGDLSGDACSNWSADGGTFSSPDTAVSGGRCYRYTFTIRDNVGNASASVTATAKVDTDAPSVNVTAPAELTGAGNQHYVAGSQTHFFRPGAAGSFSLTATASDGQSGVSQVAFPDVSALGGWSGSTGGSDTASPYSSPVDYAWGAGASAPGTRSITATNAASIDGVATITIAADAAAPTGQSITLTGASAPYYNTPSVTFTLTDGSDGSGAGIDTGTRNVSRETGDLVDGSCSNFSADAGSFSSPDTAVSNGHCYRYTFSISDNVGNVSAAVSATAKVDTQAPQTTIDSSPNDPTNDTTPTFDFSSSETGSTFECRIDGGSWNSCTSPDTLSALGAGSHTYEVRATDQAGNTDPTPASFTWTIDLTAPNTTIDSAPPAIDNDATPPFTFSSNEPGSSFECAVDGGNWSTCTSPHTVAPALAEGSHTFEVRATDRAGNTDGTPAAHTWNIDLGPPTVAITAPTTYLNGSDPSTYSVTASSPDGDVDHVDFYECSNASTDCASGTWNQFGTDGSAPYAADWSTPATDGTRAIRAVAVDVAANTGEHVRTITIDRTAPTNVTVSYPDGYVFGSFTITTDNGTDPDVNASSAALERRLGNLAGNNCSSYAGWVAASSPDTVASGKCAQYRYRLADNAGNWTTATSANEAKSDTAAPTSIQADPGTNLRLTVSLTAVASDTGGSSLASVAFQRRPAGGGSWTTIASDTTSPYGTSFDTTSVADGLYDFRSLATDVAGNVETAPAILTDKRIDNTAPSATMVSPGSPVSGTVVLTSNTSDTGGSGIATVAYELAPNGGSFNSQPASWDTTLVGDGLYDLHVIATDAAGNSTTSPLVTTRVDNTPPAVTFNSPAAGAVVSGTVNLDASASDAAPASPAVSFAYKLHSDPPSAYTATGSSWDTTALPGGDGVYDVRARATDDAGNTTTVEHANIRVDNAAPTVAITAPPAAINGSVPSPTSLSANATDPGGSGVTQVQFFECSNQSSDCATGVWSPLGTVAAPGPYTVSWTIPGTDGNHALAAVATDNAGHPASAIRNVEVDRSAPNTSIVTKPGDPSNDVTPTFTFTSSETGSTFECSVDGGAFAPCTSPHDVTGLTDNSHDFEVRATDPAGNTDATPAAWTWHRDTNAPNAQLNHPGNNVRQTIMLTSAENDPPANGYASGLASVTFEYSADGTSWALIGTNTGPPFNNMLWNTTGVADGVYQLHIVVRDQAGNETVSAPQTNVRIDNTPPTTSQDDPGQYLRATKALTGSAADSGSGIDHVDFQRAPTGGGPWNTIATDSTPGDGFSVSFDTTSVSDGHYDFRTVAYDVAGNQAAATPVTDRLVDNTPPNATISSPGPYLRGSVNLTSTTGDPGGANASGVVSVAYEYSTNGGGTWQPTGSSFDTTSVPDGNVELRVTATDAAGNSTTSSSVTSLVDNTKPATTDNAPSGWQSSTVTVTLTPNDAGSGVNVTEYSVDGNPTYTVGTSVLIPAPANGSNDGAHTIAYFSVDNAGNIETVKSTTVLIDATPPACPSCSAADYLRGTVTLSASPSESGSGIKSVAFEYADAGGSNWTTIDTDTTGPAPYTADWNTVPVTDGHYDLRILVTDNADNVTTTNLPDKVVDNTAPDVANVGAPTEGQLVTGTVAIAASASDVTSPIASVRFYVRGSLLGTDTSAPFSMNWDTTTGTDGAATIQVVVEDMAGNSTSSSIRNVSVDNVSPTPTLADPGQFLSGTVSLSASSDGDTTQVDFERRPAGGGAWVTIASDNTLPWGTSLDTTALADGLYDFRVVATDQSGHTGASPIRSNVRIDNTNPAGSITTPANGATVGGSSVSLGGSYSDGGSGVASVGYELRPTGGGSWSTIATSTSSPFGATWDATTVSTGSYDLRPVITDRAGNTFAGGTITVTVDVTAPTVTLANPGATISGVVTLNASVSGNGATQVAFGWTPAGGAAWTSIGTDTASPWSTSFDTTKLADGTYDLRAVVSDSLGNTSNDVVAGIRIDNTRPRVVSSTPAEGSTVPSATSIGLVTSEPATPVGVTLDGSSTVAPVINGKNIDYNTGALAVGPHTLAGELQDAAGKKAPFRVHFTVWASSGSIAPHVEKNTSTGSATTVQAADGNSAATMPAGAWSTSGDDWLVIRIAPAAAPSGLTNGFAPGPQGLDVTARWALAGTEVHEFAQPLDILMRSAENGLVPATFENGAWRVIQRVPVAGVLPAGWDDGFYRDSSGFHLVTRHLSLFALLRDVEAPQPPQNVRGYLGSGGLTIRWTAGDDNSGTYDFVTLYSDANTAGRYGVDYTAASIAGWAPGDPRIFRVKETDLAGNESALTRALLPVPSLAGKTIDQAAALLAAHGFTLGTVTPGGSGKPGTITGPAGLALAEEGGAIDVTVAPGGAGFAVLALKVHTAPKFKPAARKKIAARVSLTRAARVTAELFSPRGKKIFTWRFSAKAGRSIVKLKIPRQVRRPGVYSIRWTARAGKDAASRRIKIRIVGTRTLSLKRKTPVEVVLAGRAPSRAGSKLPKRKPKVVMAAGIEPTFDAAANRKADARVIVVDADQFGISFIRDLHTVFPSAKIVALTSSPRVMVLALKAGAVVALPRSTPPAMVARVVQRLLSPAKKPAKPPRPHRTQGPPAKN